MTDTVEFREDTHQYFVNNVEYPSVSTVLQMFTDLSRIPRDVLERKRQIGRATHAAIALDAADDLDLDSLDPQVIPYFESWVKFKKDMPGKVSASEQIVFSKKHRYAGRLDVNYVLDRDKALWQLDIKCVDRMSPVTALQTAAYAEAWNELHPNDKQITRRAGLQLKPGGYELFPYTKPEHRNDLMVFFTALNLHRWMANHA